MARKSAFARIDVTNGIAKLEKAKREARLATQDLQMEAADAGAEKMREYVRTRGTGVMWSRVWLGRNTGTPKQTSGPGRIDSGNMLNAIRARFEQGPQRIIAAFGWIGNVEPYFYAQEYGVKKGKRAGKRNAGVTEVSGMFALRDARLYVVNILPKLARKYAKRIARGAY